MGGMPYLEGLLLKRDKAVAWRFFAFYYAYVSSGRLGD